MSWALEKTSEGEKKEDDPRNNTKPHEEYSFFRAASCDLADCLYFLRLCPLLLFKFVGEHAVDLDACAVKSHRLKARLFCRLNRSLA